MPGVHPDLPGVIVDAEHPFHVAAPIRGVLVAREGLVLKVCYSGQGRTQKEIRDLFRGTQIILSAHPPGPNAASSGGARVRPGVTGVAADQHGVNYHAPVGRGFLFIFPLLRRVHRLSGASRT